tara:strand:+ start:83 stop:310 length:228 start_codon:yes stop_codon:yes gene_type:complete
MNNKLSNKFSLNIKPFKIEEYPKTEKRNNKFVNENKTTSKIKPINLCPLHMLFLSLRLGFTFLHIHIALKKLQRN